MRRLCILLCALLLSVSASAAPTESLPPIAGGAPWAVTSYAEAVQPNVWHVVNGVLTGPLIAVDGVLAGDGSASAPSYSFANFTSTGLFAATGPLLSASVGGTEVWRATSGGVFGLGGGTLGFGATQASVDLSATREAADHWFQRRTTNAQRASWANTYTSSTNYEAFSVDWQTTANVALVGTRTAATGAARTLMLAAQNSSASTSYAQLRLQGSTVGAPLARLMWGDSAALVHGTSITGTMFNLAAIESTATSGTVVTASITPTYNQAASTAANTDLLINRTQTAIGSGAQRLLDLQVGGVTQFNVDNVGLATAIGGMRSDVGFAVGVAPSGARLRIAQGTISVDAPSVDVTSTWNAGGVTFTGWKQNVTDTASASGSLLMDLQVAAASKFSVSKAGAVVAASDITTSTNFTASAGGSIGFSGGTLIKMPGPANGKLAFTTNNGSSGLLHFQLSDNPTCATNCGTSPTLTGVDSSFTLTMGATGAPASGFIVTFNGTWGAAPQCNVNMGLAGMAVGKMPLTVVTTVTTVTVVTNGTAPANNDVYHFQCTQGA